MERTKGKMVIFKIFTRNPSWNSNTLNYESNARNRASIGLLSKKLRQINHLSQNELTVDLKQLSVDLKMQSDVISRLEEI